MAGKVFCKKCGYDSSSIQSLTSHPCRNGGKCEPYEGSAKPKYTCKKCGYDSSSIQSLTSHPCRNGGKCEPAR